MITQNSSSIILQKLRTTSPDRLVTSLLTKIVSHRLLPETKVQTWLRALAFRKAVGRAYTKFAIRHPRWADSYFDEYFVQHFAARLLAGYMQQPVVPPSPAELATRWAEQFRVNDPARKYIAKVTPVAEDFLNGLEAEWNDIQCK